MSIFLLTRCRVTFIIKQCYVELPDIRTLVALVALSDNSHRHDRLRLLFASRDDLTSDIGNET